MVKNNKRNNGGFTIAEVVVTMGALGVMALVFMSLSKNFNQLSNQTQYAVDKVFYLSFFSKQLAKNDGEFLNQKRASK